MRNVFAIAFGIVTYLCTAALVIAAVPSLSIRIEQPKSPTYINNLRINTVTLDRLERVVTVQCYKKGPSEAGFVQFGSTLVLAAGGNSANCEPSTILNADGTYQFYAVATAGEDSATSPTVTVDYNTSGPGTPTNYSKQKIDSCTYKINFRSAEDNGKTVQISIFRSENTSFNLDSGTLVGTVSIGSATEGSFNNTVPDCNKTYYYAIRAFDVSGNGSGVVGDSETRITSTTTSTTSGASGAAGGAIASGTNGNILGAGTDDTTAGNESLSPTPEVLGDEAIDKESTTEANKLAGSTQKYVYWIAAGFLAVLAVYLLRKKQQS